MAEQERIALFIDGANLYATAKALGFDIDYKRLLGVPEQGPSYARLLLHRAGGRSGIFRDPPADRLARLQRLFRRHQADERVRRFTGRRKVKGNMDIELAVDAMEMAEHLDHIVLFSGDGDFRSLVEAVQRKGVRVSVVSTIARSRRWWPTNCGVRPTNSSTSSTSSQDRPRPGRASERIAASHERRPLAAGECTISRRLSRRHRGHSRRRPRARPRADRPPARSPHLRQSGLAFRGDRAGIRMVQRAGAAVRRRLRRGC